MKAEKSVSMLAYIRISMQTPKSDWSQIAQRITNVLQFLAIEQYHQKNIL